jgi:outer membrane protein OmpA-like peptidoglycan-associated protein
MSWRTGLAKFITGVVVATLVSTAATITSPLASAATINQVSPTSGSIDVAGSATFTVTLAVDPSFVGVTFANATLNFTITSSGVLSTPGPLAVGTYNVSGTDGDGSGDNGTWSYSLTVTNTIVQGSPNSGSIDVAGSGAFAPTLTAAPGFGPVTFAHATLGFTITPSGVLSTPGPLTAAGSPYLVSGTDTDPQGDTGTWTYTLSVTGVVVTVTFDANGGTGAMTPESASAPTALTLNHFTRARHIFINWNTAANGSGVSYANGAVFPFGASTTLFAQWKSGRVPSHTITFAAHGGTGKMARETHNTPTAISKNHFRRTGYTFLDWTTSAKRSRKHFKAGATYSFKTSVTLYARWKRVPKKPSPVVTFVANRGAGTMASEIHRGPTKLTPDHFRRTGYTFIDWNTAANGSGVRYANGDFYPFATSTTLYAQWKKNKKIIPPPPPPKITGPVVGPFALRSSILSPTLESQIHSIADEAKAKGDKQIALLGYGDKLTAAAERNKSLSAKNVELGRTRAQAVATYLQGRLAALGLKGWTISISAAGVAKPGSIQYETKIVIATLS